MDQLNKMSESHSKCHFTISVAKTIAHNEHNLFQLGDPLFTHDVIEQLLKIH